jgi:hypothetical protein
LKAFQNILIWAVFFLPFWGFNQGDSTVLPYRSFREHVVGYVDEGFSTAPFSLHYPFTTDRNKINYKNNFRTTMGIGISYRWFSLRISFPLPGNMRDPSKYGETKAFTIGTDFTLGKMFWDIDLRNYTGYAVENAIEWDSHQTKEHPNALLPSLNVFNLAINSWYFHDKNFRMSALKGKTACYLKQVHTWYVKNSLNILSLNNGSYSIVPAALIDSSNTKTASSLISSIDLGFVPGYAYVNRIKNWQFSIVTGIGFAIQTKLYSQDNSSRSFIGLAPRYDIGFIFGYTVPNYFIFLVSEFDNKSIRFNDFIYRQQFYSIRLSTGFRFETKERNKRIFQLFP